MKFCRFILSSIKIVHLAMPFMFFFVSCSTGKIYASWKGAHVSELLKVWGKPQKVKFIKNRGKIYIYDRTPGETRKSYLDNFTGPTKLIGYYVNKNGIIYNWKEKPLTESLFE